MSCFLFQFIDARRVVAVSRFALLTCTAIALLALAACTDHDDHVADDGETADIGADSGDDDVANDVPPLYLVETADDEQSGESASMLAYGQRPITYMDALMEGDLARSGECLGVEDHHQGSFIVVVWPYGYSIEFDEGSVTLLDEDGYHVAREGDPIAMGGGGGPDHDGEITASAPADCEAESYWMAGAEVQRLAPETEPDPVINEPFTAYFPQWDDEDESGAGSYAGRLVLEDECLYLHHEQAGDQRLGIWPPEWSIEADGEDVVVLDEDSVELARTGDILNVAAQFGRFDFEQYGVPAQCGGMHVMIFDLEVTGGPDDEMPEAQVQTEDEAREQDAQMYADAFDVSLDEALWRLDLQGLLRDESVNLERDEVDRFGGLFWQHEPEFRLVVLMTDGDEEAVQAHFENPELLEVLEVHSVEHSYADLQDTQRGMMELMQELGLRVSSGISVQENRVELYAGDASMVQDVLESAGEVLPEHVVLVEE